MLIYADVKSKSANRKSLCYFTFDGSSNLNPICHHLKDIRYRIVHDLDLDLQTGSWSNLNIPIDSPCATSYLMAIVNVSPIFYRL